LTGIRGVLSEAATGLDLADAIVMVAGGNSYLDRRARTLLAAYSPRRGAALTQRERDVLALLARGFSNIELARTLTLKTKTVEMYLTRICEKLGVRSRTEALVRVQQLYGAILFAPTVVISQSKHRDLAGISR
jgi:DNA-binding NarL/FixJ family response regulator